LIGTKILPGLITLSSDSDASVRVSSVSGLCRVINATKTSGETREKACFQLLSCLDVGQVVEQVVDHVMQVEVVRQLASLISSVKFNDQMAVKLRDEVILPKLAEIIFKCSSLNWEER
jgi:hypothetical protein